MPVLILSIAVQAACVIHIIRTGRNQLWLWAVILLSMVGVLAYFVAEILPGLLGSREANAMRTAAIKAIDPERELRAAREELDIARTSANQIRLGDALARLGRHGEAVAAYRAGLASAPGSDLRTTYKLALSLLESGDPAGCLDAAAALPTLLQTDGGRAELLRGRALEALGREDEAMAVYAPLVDHMPGEEVRCRYAALLIKAGRRVEAKSLLVEVGVRARRMTRRQRAEQRAMYDWAAAELARL